MRLSSQTRLPGLTPPPRGGVLGRSADEHHGTTDLVEVRDTAGVEALTRRHVGHVRGLWAHGAER